MRVYHGCEIREKERKVGADALNTNNFLCLKDFVLAKDKEALNRRQKEKKITKRRRNNKKKIVM